MKWAEAPGVLPREERRGEDSLVWAGPALVPQRRMRAAIYIPSFGAMVERLGRSNTLSVVPASRTSSSTGRANRKRAQEGNPPDDLSHSETDVAVSDGFSSTWGARAWLCPAPFACPDCARHTRVRRGVSASNKPGPEPRTVGRGGMWDQPEHRRLAKLRPLMLSRHPGTASDCFSRTHRSLKQPMPPANQGST